jgi:hypothetical protein
MSSASDPEADKLVAMAIAKANEFVAHLKAKYGNDPDVQMLGINFRSMRGLPAYANQIRPAGRRVNGQSDITTGIVEIAARDPTTNALRPVSGILTTVVHELAHVMRSFDASTKVHGQGWSKTFLKWAAVARTELGWDVRVPCHYCRYYNVCDPVTCPKCQWDCGKQSPSGSLFPDRQNTPLAQAPQSTVARVCASASTYPWLQTMCAQAKGGGGGGGRGGGGRPRGGGGGGRN